MTAPPSPSPTHHSNHKINERDPSYHYKHAWFSELDAPPSKKAHRRLFPFKGKELKHEQIKRIVDYAVEKGYRTDADIPGEEVEKLLSE